MTGLRDQLKAKLSATGHGSDEGEGTGAFELAERIKARKAANSVEATPQRVRQKHSSAEEPVTSRIRRRTEASNPTILPDAAASAAGTSPPRESVAQAIPEDLTPSAPSSELPGTTRNSSIKSEMTFQERIAMERRRTEGPEILL
ncbi:MAG: hypothetical protein WD847_11540 [Pirellulales bacterium]